MRITTSLSASVLMAFDSSVSVESVQTASISSLSKICSWYLQSTHS